MEQGVGFNDRELVTPAGGDIIQFTTLLSGQYPNKFNWLSSVTYAEPLAV